MQGGGSGALEPRRPRREGQPLTFLKSQDSESVVRDGPALGLLNDSEQHPLGPSALPSPASPSGPPCCRPLCSQHGTLQSLREGL